MFPLFHTTHSVRIALYTLSLHDALPICRRHCTRYFLWARSGWTIQNCRQDNGHSYYNSNVLYSGRVVAAVFASSRPAARIKEECSHVYSDDFGRDIACARWLGGGKPSADGCDRASMDSGSGRAEIVMHVGYGGDLHVFYRALDAVIG